MTTRQPSDHSTLTAEWQPVARALLVAVLPAPRDPGELKVVPAASHEIVFPGSPGGLSAVSVITCGAYPGGMLWAKRKALSGSQAFLTRMRRARLAP